MVINTGHRLITTDCGLRISVTQSELAAVLGRTDPGILVHNNSGNRYLHRSLLESPDPKLISQQLIQDLTRHPFRLFESWICHVLICNNKVLHLFETIRYLEIFVFCYFLIEQVDQLLFLRILRACLFEVSLVQPKIVLSVCFLHLTHEMAE